MFSSQDRQRGIKDLSAVRVGKRGEEMRWGRREKKKKKQEKPTASRSCAGREDGAEHPGGCDLDSGQHPFKCKRGRSPPCSKASPAWWHLIFTFRLGEQLARRILFTYIQARNSYWTNESEFSIGLLGVLQSKFFQN